MIMLRPTEQKKIYVLFLCSVLRPLTEVYEYISSNDWQDINQVTCVDRAFEVSALSNVTIMNLIIEAKRDVYLDNLTKDL